MALVMFSMFDKSMYTYSYKQITIAELLYKYLDLSNILIALKIVFQVKRAKKKVKLILI